MMPLTCHCICSDTCIVGCGIVPILTEVLQLGQKPTGNGCSDTCILVGCGIVPILTEVLQLGQKPTGNGCIGQ